MANLVLFTLIFHFYNDVNIRKKIEITFFFVLSNDAGFAMEKQTRKTSVSG